MTIINSTAPVITKPARDLGSEAKTTTRTSRDTSGREFMRGFMSGGPKPSDKTEVLFDYSHTATATKPVNLTVTGDLQVDGKILSEGNHGLANGTTLTITANDDGTKNITVESTAPTLVEHKATETTIYERKPGEFLDRSLGGSGRKVLGVPPGQAGMLVLSRKKDEKIVIGDNITITIVEMRGDKVRIGIEAPKEISVHRREVYDAIKRKEADEADQTEEGATS